MYILILIWSLSCCHFLLLSVPETEINKLMISPFDFVCPLGGNRHTAGSHRLFGAFPGGCLWTAKLHRGAVLYGEDKRSDGVREAFVGGTSKWRNFFETVFFPPTSRMAINNAGLFRTRTSDLKTETLFSLFSSMPININQESYLCRRDFYAEGCQSVELDWISWIGLLWLKAFDR